MLTPHPCNGCLVQAPNRCLQPTRLPWGAQFISVSPCLKQKNVFYVHVSLVLFGFIMMFDSCVFGGLPKCASNVLFVTELGIRLIDCIIFVTIWAKSALDYNGSDCIIGIRRLIV